MSGSFICVCPICGSTEWLEIFDDENTKINGIVESGDLLFRNRIPQTAMCTDCEASLQNIPIKFIPKNLRKELFFMDKEDKINWSKGWGIANKLGEELDV